MTATTRDAQVIEAESKAVRDLVAREVEVGGIVVSEVAVRQLTPLLAELLRRRAVGRSTQCGDCEAASAADGGERLSTAAAVRWCPVKKDDSDGK